MKGYLVKPNWGIPTLNGDKSMELRTGTISIRGTVCVSFSGRKDSKGRHLILGTVDIVDCIELDKESFDANRHRHLVQDSFESTNYRYGWCLENPVYFKKPIPYDYKLGCVIWFNAPVVSVTCTMSNDEFKGKLSVGKKYICTGATTNAEYRVHEDDNREEQLFPCSYFKDLSSIDILTIPILDGKGI